MLDAPEKIIWLEIYEQNAEKNRSEYKELLKKIGSQPNMPSFYNTLQHVWLATK